MSDYTVSGSLGDVPDEPSKSKPKQVRQKQIPIKDLIAKAVAELEVQDQKQVEAILKQALDEVHNQNKASYEMQVAKFREVLGNFGASGKATGAFIKNLSKIMDKYDSDKVKKFDEVTEFARDHFPDIIAKGGDDADGLVNALLTDYPKRPHKRSTIDDALEFAMQEGRITEDKFDYSVFNQDQPTSAELFDLFQKQVSDPADDWEENGSREDSNFELYAERWQKRLVANGGSSEPLSEQVLNSLRKLIEDAGDEVIKEGSITKFTTNDPLLDQFQIEAIKDYIREKGFEAASSVLKESGVEFINLELEKRQTSFDAVNNAWNAAAAKSKPKTQTESLQDVLDSVVENQKAVSIDDLVENKVFSVEEMQDMLRGKPKTPASGGKNKDSDVNDMKFSAVESLLSQLLSRMFGTSFYPVLTALRTARQLTKLETGEEVSINDIIGFTNNATSNSLTEGLKSLGLGKYANMAHSILGVPQSKSEKSEVESALERSAESLDTASSNLDSSSNSLESLAENGAFGGGGGGDVTDNDGFSIPGDDDGDGDGKKEMSPAEKIAALLGLGAYGGIMLKLISDAIPKINGLVSDQIGFIGNLATQSVSNPKSVSGVELAGQPIKAAAGAANVAAPFLGASLGRKAIGKAAGGLLGKGISSIAGSGAGATLGTALGGPIVGTVIGAAVGSIVGGLIESTVSSALDFLKSIDEGISDLAGELMPYNSELVAATVEANLKSLESQLNQADYLGPILAENVRAKNDFEIAMREFGTEFTAAFAPYLTSMYELLTPVVKYGTEQVASLNILVALGQDFLRLATTRQIDFQDTWDSIKHYLDIIAGNTKKESEFLQELEDFINPSLNQQALDPSLLNNTGAFGKTSFGPNGVIF